MTQPPLKKKFLADNSCYFAFDFFAMASPCQLLVNCQDESSAYQISQLCFTEVKRIEQKYSRYLVDNVCHRINSSQGKPVAIDEETFRLLQYAEQLYQMSDGLFDITSGVLARLWQFKAGSTPPQSLQVNALLKSVGFDKLSFSATQLTLTKNMQIDFGGIVKEYCVDACAKLIQPLAEKYKISFLINLGGDLIAKNLSSSHLPWTVGIEEVATDSEEIDSVEIESNRVEKDGIEDAGREQLQKKLIQLANGAVATSGSAKRYFDYKGKRYAHILNPQTGYPVEGAPRSVTTFANTCSLAGSLSTLAQLQGAKAESFLQQQGVDYHCYW